MCATSYTLRFTNSNAFFKLKQEEANEQLRRMCNVSTRFEIVSSPFLTQTPYYSLNISFSFSRPKQTKMKKKMIVSCSANKHENARSATPSWRARALLGIRRRRRRRRDSDQ